MIRIQAVSKEAFEKYGRVIEFTPGVEDNFEIVARETDCPWRVAVFRYTNKSAGTFENHPHSMETLEPLKGLTLLLVAENNSPENFEAFILTKPVCLFKGCWHQVIALTAEAEIKITENLEVTSEFYVFPKAIEAVAGMFSLGGEGECGPA